MSDIGHLPIVELTSSNIEHEWAGLLHAVEHCSFVALDLEMSGLGNRKHLRVEYVPHLQN